MHPLCATSLFLFQRTIIMPCHQLPEDKRIRTGSGADYGSPDGAGAASHAATSGGGASLRGEASASSALGLVGPAGKTFVVQGRNAVKEGLQVGLLRGTGGGGVGVRVAVLSPGLRTPSGSGALHCMAELRIPSSNLPHTMPDLLCVCRATS